MPFDGLPAELLTDLARLRVALAGVRTGWKKGDIGNPHAERHCAIGWLLEATDWNRDEAVRLAVQYVYPALPPKSQTSRQLESIWKYNDRYGAKAIGRLFAEACRLAEQLPDR